MSLTRQQFIEAIKTAKEWSEGFSRIKRYIEENLPVAIDFYYQDQDGDYTPLGIAIQAGNLDTFKELLRLGADINKINYLPGNDVEPLYPLTLISRMSAEIDSDEEITTFKKFVDILMASKQGLSTDSILQILSRTSNPVVLIYLFKTLKLDINTCDDKKNSALHYIIKRRIPTAEKVTLIQTLINLGLNPNQQNENGETALHLLIRVYDQNYYMPVFRAIFRNQHLNLSLTDINGKAASQCNNAGDPRLIALFKNHALKSTIEGLRTSASRDTFFANTARDIVVSVIAPFLSDDRVPLEEASEAAQEISRLKSLR